MTAQCLLAIRFFFTGDAIVTSNCLDDFPCRNIDRDGSGGRRNPRAWSPRSLYLTGEKWVTQIALDGAFKIRRSDFRCQLIDGT